MARRLLVGALASVALVFCAADPVHGAVWWAVNRGDFNSIGRANPNGTAPQPQFLSAANPCGVDVSAAGIWWAEYPSRISHANLDGTGGAVLLADLVDPPDPDAPCGIAVGDAHFYWASGSTFPSGAGTIGRSALDGSGAEPGFIAGQGDACSVAVDAAHVYWAHCFGGTTIGRAKLDGTDVDATFIEGLTGVGGVAVDGAHVYWSSVTSGAIGRAGLDGDDIEADFIPGGPGGRSRSLAVDAAHIYWDDTSDALNSRIARADLDGTDVDYDFIAEPGGGVWGLAAEPRVITTTGLTLSPASSLYGTPLTATAPVAGTDSADPSPPAPSGTVTLLVNGEDLGVSAPAGSAISSPFYFDVGDSTRARYAGDSHYLPSGSPEAATRVSAARTTMRIASNANPVPSGGTVEVRVDVTNTSTSVPPSGWVEFAVNGVGVAFLEMVDGEPTVARLVADVPPGDYTVGARFFVYGGAPLNFDASFGSYVQRVFAPVAPVAAPPPPSPGSPSMGAALRRRDLSAMVATLVGALRRRGFAALRGGPQKLTVAGPGVLTQRVVRRAGKKRVLIASGRRSFPAAGQGSLRLRLTAAGRRAVRRARRLRLEIVTRFAPRSGQAVKVVRRITVRRR